MSTEIFRGGLTVREDTLRDHGVRGCGREDQNMVDSHGCLFQEKPLTKEISPTAFFVFTLVSFTSVPFSSKKSVLSFKNL